MAEPASGSSVTGKAGLDTSLPATDSKLTVSGRGKYADLKVTVNQTKNLLNQAISVGWTGAPPTKRAPGAFGSNYMHIVQCWGEDDGTVPGNPGPPPSQCVFGATHAVHGGLQTGLFPQGSFTMERIISINGWGNFDPSAGVYEDRTRWVWQPFKGVDGTVIGPHYNQDFNPDRVTPEGEDPPSYWQNPYFSIVTTNEIVGARTAADGSGADLFEVTTGIENSGLGCGQAVEPVASGGKRVPKCWLVLVPRGDPTDENVGTQYEDNADQWGVMTSPLAPNSWKHRVAIPLEFTPVDSKCSLSDDQRRIAGTELIIPAVSSWQLKLCEAPGRKPYAYGRIGDANARAQLINPTPGSAEMIVVSRAVPQEALDPDNPVVYAPLTLSGVVVGLNVERVPSPNADAAAQQIAGVRVAEINLTPRLLAKLLTQSYRIQVDIKALPAPYEWVKHNPSHLGHDKDFLRFNPEFNELVIPGGKNFGGLLLPVGNSDLARQVWEYIFADPEAKAWLDGKPDEFGMKVNPLYATTDGANSSGTAFGDPVPSSFPKSDPYCYQGPDVGPAHDVTPPLLCGPDWLPYTQGLRDGARLTRLSDDGAKIAEDTGAPTPDKVYKRDIPPTVGRRVMLSLTDTASAYQYGLQSARLSRAGDNDASRTFIAPNAAGMTAAFEAMKPGSEPAVLEPDPRAAAPSGYPLTAITYAATRPLSIDADARKDYADFVAYAAGDGQSLGLGGGKLPEGYAPLPATLKTQSANAAKSILEMTAASVAQAANGRGGAGSGDGGSSDSPPDFGGGLFRSGSANESSLTTDPATITSPVLGAASGDGSLLKRVLTPAVAIAFTRFILPALLLIALASGYGAIEIGRRHRAEVS